VWPELSAPALLARLYDDADFLRRCSGSALTDDERAALMRPAPRSVKSIKWTPADTVLLDELDALLRGTDTYVHAVVDEAQDLSAMQCRAIGRRCPLGSVTVLGDLAQATTPWAPGDWAITLRHLGHDAVVRPLTAGYRVPGEVLEVANRLLPYIATDVPPATSIRQGEGALGFAARAALGKEIRECLGAEGSIGVIVPDAQATLVLDELRRSGLDAHPLEDGTDPQLAVVPASSAKGLEFDSVVIVEPSAIVDAEPNRVDGLRRLYVVLTRAVSRLRIVHDLDLPAEMG
jgi:DNA helicase IV